MKDVLILSEYPRVDHYKQKGNKTEFNYFNTQMGKILSAVVKEYANITRRNYDFDYVYKLIPEPLQVKNNKVLKYKEPTLKEVNNPVGQNTLSFKDQLYNTIIQGKPKVVVPTGKLGTKLLVGETSITKVRGVPQEITLENDLGSHTFWVLPTFSVEYVSVKPNLERYVATDFRTIGKFLSHGDSAFKPEETHYELVTSIDRVKEIFHHDIQQQYDEYKITAWDLETTSLRPDLPGAKALVLTMTWKHGQGVTIPLYKSDFQWENGQQDIDTILDLFKEWQKDKEQQKVGHNLNYDLKFLRLTENLEHAESNQDTKVGWYLAVSQEKAESLRLSNLSYEATTIGGYDKPLEDFKVWYKQDLLKYLEKLISEKVSANKDIAKKEYKVNKTDYNSWIKEKIDPNAQVELDKFDKQTEMTNIDKQYLNLGLNIERVTRTQLMNNPDFEKVVNESPEFMNLSDKGKDYVITNALNQINTHKKSTKVKNKVDGGDFNYDWIPLELLHDYASGDTDACRRIYIDVRDRLKTRPKAVRLLTHDYPRLTRTLTKMEANGLYVDYEYAKSNNQAYSQELENIIKKINEFWGAREVVEYKTKMYELGLEEMNKPTKERDNELLKWRNKYKNETIDFNPQSSWDKGKLFFDILGVELPYQKEFITKKVFEDGKPESELVWEDYKTDKGAIKYIAKHYPELQEIMDLFLEYSAISTRKSTFTETFLEKVSPVTGALHGTFNETGTECVSGDTLLITSNGIQEIQNISDCRKEKEFTNVQMSVPNHLGEISNASDFYYSGVGKSLTITLENGLELTASYNHPLRKNIYYSKGKSVNKNKSFEKHLHELEWVESRNLKKGDYLQVSLDTQMFGNKVDLDINAHSYVKKTTNVPYVLPKTITPELAEFIGMYMADGNIKTGNGTKAISITNSSKQVRDRIIYLVSKLFNIVPKDKKSHNRVEYVTFNSLGLVTWLENVLEFRHGAPNKTVPKIVLESTKEVQQAFIKGLSLDSSTKKKKYPSIYFSSVSKELIDRLNIMLNNLGYFTRLSKSIDTRGYLDCYSLQLTYENVEKYISEIGFVQNEKHSICQDKLKNYLVNKPFKPKKEGVIQGENVTLVKVKSVKENGEIPLFDLHVPNEHSFVGNSIINHNTSRLSSSNPNLQNIPAKTTDVTKFDYKHPIKRTFASRFKNGVLVGADYANIEMRIIGLFCKDNEMTQSFIDGDDIHKATASIVNQVPIEQVTAEQRQKAKAVNFGLAFGETPFSFAGKNDMEVEEAERIFNQYYETKPKVKQGIDNTHDFVEQNGYVETMSGHRRFLKGAQSSDLKTKNQAFRQSFNAIVQGSASYLTNMSLTFIDDYIVSRGLKSKMIATVHDSLLIDCPPEEVREITKVVKHIMENLPFDFLMYDMNGNVIRYPISADTEISFNYNDVVDYDDDEFVTFNSAKGYIDYYLALNKIKYTFESGVINEEQKEQLQSKVKEQKSLYQNM